MGLEESVFGGGGDFVAVLLLDRSHADALCRRAAWTRMAVAVAGAVVVVCVALAWWASVRLVAARGRARLLETEARHLRELSQAAAGLAHDTRNPLGLIRGWAQQLARAEVGPEARQEHTHAVIEECDRLTARINQFLAFARTSRLHPEPVDLRALVGELRHIIQPDMEAKQLDLKTSLPGRLGKIQADRELLRQALFNLLQNAVQFSPARGTIEVAVVPGENGAWRIEVADRGPGVAEKDVENLFIPYFTKRPDGTGLGLAIVRRIALQHGWQARYRPRPGGGAVFSLDGIHG